MAALLLKGYSLSMEGLLGCLLPSSHQPCFQRPGESTRHSQENPVSQRDDQSGKEERHHFLRTNCIHSSVGTSCVGDIKGSTFSLDFDALRMYRRSQRVTFRGVIYVSRGDSYCMTACNTSQGSNWPLGSGCHELIHVVNALYAFHRANYCQET